jgi:hypothetical protein
MLSFLITCAGAIAPLAQTPGAGTSVQTPQRLITRTAS